MTTLLLKYNTANQWPATCYRVSGIISQQHRQHTTRKMWQCHSGNAKALLLALPPHWPTSTNQTDVVAPRIQEQYDHHQLDQCSSTDFHHNWQHKSYCMCYSKCALTKKTSPMSSEFKVVDSLVRGLGCAYQDRQDFYWHMGAISVGCPSCARVPVGVEPRLAGCKSITLTTEPRPLIDKNNN